MKIPLIITTASLLLSARFLYRKPKTELLERAVTAIHFTVLPLLVLAGVLLFQNLRFAGRYTNALIAFTFAVSGILLFGVTTSGWRKVYGGFIAVPALLTEIALLFAPNAFLLPAIFAFLVFGPPRLKEKITDDYDLEVDERFMGRDPFYLVQHRGLLDKRVFLEHGTNYFGEILKIKILGFNERESVACAIYCRDSANPVADTLTFPLRN